MYIGSIKAVYELSSCDVTVSHTGTLSHNQVYLGNAVMWKLEL